MKKSFAIIAATLCSLMALAQAPAFPGAEGHGRYVTGGRASNGSTKVYHVTNLNDSGNGSLRWALSQSGPRTIVFDVGGVIALNSDLKIPANTTIAGQTAPAPGITLRYYTLLYDGNNIIVRFIRSRRGQEKDVNDGADATWTRNHTSIILDHCSFSWSIDEVASFYDNNNFTMQWSTIGESLNNAGHGKGAHGYGGIWGGKLASFHHNLILHVNNRSPRFNGARYNWTGYSSNKLYSQYQWKNAVQAENVDFRNCVVYNCGNGCYGGPGGGQINMVNNYYKNGPAGNTSYITTASVANSTSSSDNKIYWDMFSRYYISGNQLNATANADWSKMNYDSGTKTKDGIRYTPDPNHYYGDGVTYETIDDVDCVSMKLDTPAPTGEISTHTASHAYEKVISYAGASLYRDDVDKRYATETRNGTATYKGSVTGKAGRIDLVSDVNGYTEENFGSSKRAASFDADNDGMADEWEQLNGGDLDPNAYTLDSDKQWYTNLEVYLNSLVEDIMKDGNADGESNYEEYYPTCQKLPADNDEDPQQTANSSITWPFDTGNSNQTANLIGTAETGITSTSVTLGEDLAYDGKQSTLAETKIQDRAMLSSAAADANAITFSIQTATGYKFTATNASATATRIGTDAGSLDIRWKDAGGTTVLCQGVKPNRDNGSPAFSTYSFELKEDAKATEGTCSLIINMYGVTTGYKKDSNNNPTTEINYKDYGFSNISIEGILTNTAGISTPVSFGTPVATEYFTIDGRRLQQPQHGVNIQVARMANGKKVTTKVIK